MTNEERWNTFISKFRNYVEEHHLGPSKHTDLYNQCRYYRKKAKAGTLDEEKAKELEGALEMRDLGLHTGGRKKKPL